jgi:hypothetical protein
MRCYQILLLPLVASFALLIAVAVAQQPSPLPADKSAPAPPARQAAKADPQGTKTLDEAIKQLDPKKLAWVQTTFWERADVQGLSFQAEGSYLSAPDHRLHLDLNVHMDDAKGKLEIVSDGTRLWEAMQLGQQPRFVRQKVELAKVLESLNGNVEADKVRDEFFQAQLFAGIVPLLQSIQKRMIVTRQDKARHNGKEATKLTAGWGPEISKAISTSDKPWPAFYARQCCIYLEPLGPEKILWPQRFEWWGPAPPRPGDSMLLEIEFRDPKLNQPLSPERCAQEFKFEPGTGEIPDRTEQAVESVKARAEQLVKQKKGR